MRAMHYWVLAFGFLDWSASLCLARPLTSRLPPVSAAVPSLLRVSGGGGGGDGVVPAEYATASTWRPRGDALDKKIVKLALPAALNFLILPLVGTVDTLWVGRLGQASSLAALGAANQVFSSVFFVVSFIPSVVTPLVAAAHAAGDDDLVRGRVRDAFWLSAVVGLAASFGLAAFPRRALSLALPASADAATAAAATAYLSVRALALAPAMLAFVGFATCRGLLDVVTPLRVSLATQGLNLVLDPILIFTAGLGVAGAAAATAIAECAAAASYVVLLARKNVLKPASLAASLRPPPLKALAPLVGGGAGVLARSVAMNVAFLAITRRTQALDPSGATAAAHTIAMQVWQLGGVVLFALSSVAAMLVPATLNSPERGGKLEAKKTADRMLGWGLAAGVGLGLCQLALLPLLSVFSPVPEIRAAARAPAIIGAGLQLINGVTFVAEGVMQGHAAFFPLARNAALASAGLLAALRSPLGDSLPGVWYSFAVFNSIRFLGAYRHHKITGPLGSRNLHEPHRKD